MINPIPLTLEGHGVRLEPLAPDHVPALAEAVLDGRLWELWFTSVPAPDQVDAYVRRAFDGQRAGHMLPWVVREATAGAIIGTTRYHDIVASIDRVEIGYTFYAARWQRTHVNTACKLLLLQHAFEGLGCKVVGLRTDTFNFASQRAIEGLGAKRDGVLRHHQARRDGTVRDSVMYSILAAEWPDVKRHLEGRLARHARGGRVVAWKRRERGPGSTGSAVTAMEQVRRLFEHVDWADRRILELLAAEGDDAPEPALRTFAHILGAERVWLLRLRGEDSRAQPVWPVLSMEELHALAAANRADYARHLEGLREIDLSSILEYTNQQGRPFRTAVGDILLHVALHGSYHRGQVARSIREAGGEPVNTDFITYARELAG